MSQVFVGYVTESSRGVLRKKDDVAISLVRGVCIATARKDVTEFIGLLDGDIVYWAGRLFTPKGVSSFISWTCSTELSLIDFAPEELAFCFESVRSEVPADA